METSYYIILAAVVLGIGILLLPGCKDKQIMDGPDMMMNTYQQISQEKAKEMMDREENLAIVDVRRQDEYDAGHIPGAILIPNETIKEVRPEELPDLYQTILVYCRSGNRSKQAAQKLADMGYTNVYEFGGIMTWKGETVTEETEAIKTEKPEEYVPKSTAMLVMEANGKVWYPTLSDNSSAEAFFEKLEEEKLTVEMHDYNHFEKVGSLPWDLPRNDEEITTVPGDIILYQGNQITIYYDENTWQFTRLGRIENVTGEELKEVLGEGNVTVSFWLEWSE